MVGTQTKFISFAKLSKLTGAETIVTVALVCNDLAIANASMGRYKQIEKPSLSYIRIGGMRYFSRLICGHLHEGMKAIKGVRQDQRLLNFVGQCSKQAQDAFAALCECLRGGREEHNFKKYGGRIRNGVAFHYDPSDLRWALEGRSKWSTAETSSLTGGSDIHTTRFEFADDLLDSIVCRKLWEIPRRVDVIAEADRIGNWCNTKCVEYLRFGEHFVPRFLLDHNITVLEVILHTSFEQAVFHLKDLY